MADRDCAHLNAITIVKHAKKRECDECVKTGDSWVHLRTCQECGRTLCCDNSRNRHASRHAKACRHRPDGVDAGGNRAVDSGQEKGMP